MVGNFQNTWTNQETRLSNFIHIYFDPHPTFPVKAAMIRAKIHFFNNFFNFLALIENSQNFGEAQFGQIKTYSCHILHRYILRTTIIVPKIHF